MYKFIQYLVVLISTQAYLNSNNNEVIAKWNIGSNPGIIIRLEEKTIKIFKSSLEKFLPSYI